MIWGAESKLKLNKDIRLPLWRKQDEASKKQYVSTLEEVLLWCGNLTSNKDIDIHILKHIVTLLINSHIKKWTLRMLLFSNRTVISNKGLKIWHFSKFWCWSSQMASAKTKSQSNSTFLELHHDISISFCIKEEILKKKVSHWFEKLIECKPQTQQHDLYPKLLSR